ncbi:MAG: Ser-Thr-rich glycosyl-phosphatidyl-inositol-anchored membrane family-domain-containing protein [Piptocephalis tieghemiana]|nr:MAG: Ser-Thr-rich glycosyl-phosphatidyl-inositol-anchored membrane family-domain-containing protein [Piptocephalis tieghemiana]
MYANSLLIAVLALASASGALAKASITTPTSATVWNAGSPEPITWTSENPSASPISLTLMKGDPSNLKPAGEINPAVDEKTGSFTWNVPADTAPGQYTIRIAGGTPDVNYSHMFKIEGPEGNSDSESDSDSDKEEVGYGAAPEAPAYGAAPEAPAYGAAPEAPAYGAAPETPAYGAAPEVPAYGAAPETPAYGAAPEAPAYGAVPESGREGEQEYGSDDSGSDDSDSDDSGSDDSGSDDECLTHSAPTAPLPTSSMHEHPYILFVSFHVTLGREAWLLQKVVGMTCLEYDELDHNLSHSYERTKK